MADPWPARVEGLTLSDAQRHTLTMLRIKREPPQGVLEACGLPTAPNSVAGDGPTALWLAPGEWLIAGEPPAPESRSVALAGVVHHLTDATDAFTAFDLRGAHARALISGGCSLDLHPRVFGVGCCAQSQLAGVPVLLRTLEPEPDLRLYVDVSYSAWVRSWLIDAADGFRP